MADAFFGRCEDSLATHRSIGRERRLSSLPWVVLSVTGLQVHVTDDDPFSLTRGGGLEDVSQVQKYRMSEEDYDKRKGTLR